MAVALVQTAKGSSNSVATISATFGSGTTGGNLIVVAVSYQTATANNVTGITDSQSNTYTKISSTIVSSAYVLDLWYAQGITGGATPTVTATFATSSYPNCIMMAREYSGMVTSGAFDKNASSTGISGSETSGATAVTTYNSELVIGAAYLSTAPPNWVAGTGFGNLDHNENSFSMAMEDMVVSAAGAQTATFTSASTSWVCAVATFVVSTGSPIPKPNKLRPHAFSPGIAR